MFLHGIDQQLVVGIGRWRVKRGSWKWVRAKRQSTDGTPPATRDAGVPPAARLDGLGVTCNRVLPEAGVEWTLRRRFNRTCQLAALPRGGVGKDRAAIVRCMPRFDGFSPRYRWGAVCLIKLIYAILPFDRTSTKAYDSNLY